MRSAYAVIARLIALGVLLQAAFVALGWFIVLNDVDDGQAFTKDSDWNIGLIGHSTVGLGLIPLLGLVLLIVSFFAKIPGGVKWAGLTLLAIVVQVALAFLSFGLLPAIGFLHGLNAFVILGLAEFTARRAKATDHIAAEMTGTAPSTAAV